MPSKRRKISEASIRADTAVNTGRDLFSRLPLELLAEILSSTSPKDILAVARCSKALCGILVNNESTAFIWRVARQKCKPSSLRDPTPNFTEASYAAFVFDFGNCEACGTRTKQPFFSFALRLRLCPKLACISKMRAKLDFLKREQPPEYYAVRKWVPCIESCIYEFGSYRNTGSGELWPSTFRKSDCEIAMRELNEFHSNGGTLKEYIMGHIWDAKKRGIVLAHSEYLCHWWRSRERVSEGIVKSNKNLAKQYANKHACDAQDVLNSVTYKELAKASESSLEPLTQLDLERHAATLITEMSQAKERRIRIHEERLYTERRLAIEAVYRNLENKHSRSDLPLQLSIFRQLPVIMSLQDKIGMTGAQLLEEIESIGKFCDLNIQAWRDQTEKRFTKLLCIPLKRYSNVPGLKVVQRATSLFLCKECLQHEKKRPIRSLSFVEACRHRCVARDKGRPRSIKWRVDQFTADKKGINVVRQALNQLGKKEDETAPNDLCSLGDIIRCTTCEGNILLNFNTMIQHCHRHDAMQVEALSPDIAKKMLHHPIPYGHVEDIYSRKPGARKKRERRVYSCRHCVKDETIRADSTVNGMDVDATSASCMHSHPKMSFDGFRAHAKTKHRIEHIADEDFIVHSHSRVG